MAAQSWEAVRDRIQAGGCEDPATAYAMVWLTILERESYDRGMPWARSIVNRLRREYQLLVAPVLGLPGA